ncbi:tRNA lysidine(34) synthetase TilS [Leeia aquatica]|uniref:tRNA(Ile)-lysidine synthase n=1 Tax=Leeia aquatica TaxID=2725557 RepID=A0A847RVV7_9NEIS|nr:tRNA lysidine(34) synthetase TilS [Leeia aquatica]NLR73951.1 tRNA lysidine(34) synthetase TilS [Leeia aquatica]
MQASPYHALDEALSRLAEPPRQLWVALSGGLDSVCLLHAAQHWAKAHAVPLAACHVHHGLQAVAEEWVTFCEQLCSRWQIPLTVQRCQVARKGGESLEAVARRHRYQALYQTAEDVLLLAQHQDDQMETLFMQLLRGAGPEGLQGMASEQAVGTLRQLRPWLALPRQTLETYAQQHQLPWVEDPSNQDTRFDRNFWRQQLLPQLAQRYPAYRQTLTRSQWVQQDAAACLAELAEQDRVTVAEGEGLSVAALLALPAHRQRNLLRHQLCVRHQQRPPSWRWLEALREALQAVRPDALLQVSLPGAAGSVRVYRGVLYWVADFTPPREACDWVVQYGDTALPGWGGRVQVRATEQGGWPVAWLGQTLRIAPRQGGEVLKRHAKQPRQTLVKLWQAAGVPPWQRERTPLFHAEGHLVWVPGLGHDHTLQGAADMPGLEVVWRPD